MDSGTPENAALRAEHAQLQADVKWWAAERSRLSRPRSAFWRGFGLGLAAAVLLIAAFIVYAIVEFFTHFPGG
jgi:hypothetical protein